MDVQSLLAMDDEGSPMSRTSMRAPAALADRALARRPAVAVACIRATMLALTWTLALLGGCSLTIDPERPQCRDNNDCGRDFGHAYACQGGYCIQPTCRRDDDCRAYGDNFGNAICGQEDGVCQPACSSERACSAGMTCDRLEGHCSASMKTCRADDECQRRYALPICSRNGQCTQKECSTKAECVGKQTPTLECVANKCVDEEWGCLNDADPYPQDPKRPATIVFPVEAYDGSPLKGLRINVCPLAQSGDLECMRKIPGAVVTYEGGKVTVTGLSEGQRVRLAIDGPENVEYKDRLVPIDYYSQRPLRSMTQVAVYKMATQALVDAVARLNSESVTVQGMKVEQTPVGTIDRTKASLFARIYDCRGEPAEGVSVEVSDIASGTVPLYLSAEGLPVANAHATTNAGIVTFPNISAPRGKTVTVTLKLGDIRITDWVFAAIPERLTVVDLYPWKYPTQ